LIGETSSAIILTGRWRTDVGNIDGFDDLGRIAEGLDLDGFHGCSLHRR
jgi:hypothetical protein